MYFNRNLDCRWLYKAQPKNVILYRIVDISVDCGDGITVYDGM